MAVLLAPEIFGDWSALFYGSFFLVERSTWHPLPTKIGWPEDGQIGLERMD
jgi:hypothetical protein